MKTQSTSRPFVLGWSLLVVFVLCQMASASATYSFNVIQPYNNLDNALIGEAYLSVEVEAYSSTQVRFRFMNDDPLESSADEDVTGSSILSIYFDDDVFETGTFVLNNYALDAATTGVVFEEDSGAPPGGNNLIPPWKKTDSIFVADKDGDSKNGINVIGEYQDVLADGLYTDVLAALDSGSLRVALHVGSFPDGGSEAFVNGGDDRTTIVPLPSALLSGFVGLGLVSRLRRRS